MSGKRPAVAGVKTIKATNPTASNTQGPTIEKVEGTSFSCSVTVPVSFSVGITPPLFIGFIMSGRVRAAALRPLLVTASLLKRQRHGVSAQTTQLSIQALPPL